MKNWIKINKNKLYVIFISAIWVYAICKWVFFFDESKQAFIENGGMFIGISIMTIGVICYLIGKILEDFERKKNKRVIENFKKSIMASVEETRLIQSKETPTDEHIQKYYNMYINKVRSDDEWTTIEPMTFEEFEKKGKENGYRWVIGKSMDAFSFDPLTGNGTMWRYGNYDI